MDTPGSSCLACPHPVHSVLTGRPGASASLRFIISAVCFRARSLSGSGCTGFGRPTFARCITTSCLNFRRLVSSLVHTFIAPSKSNSQCFDHTGQQCLPSHLICSAFLGVSGSQAQTNCSTSSRVVWSAFGVREGVGVGIGAVPGFEGGTAPFVPFVAPSSSEKENSPVEREAATFDFSLISFFMAGSYMLTGFFRGSEEEGVLCATFGTIPTVKPTR